jgi:uncharacterized membrane protein
MIQLLQQAELLVKPWSALYSRSTPIQTAVTYVHFAGLLVAGGFALATDRLTLRMSRADAGARQLHLAELRAVHRPVLVGLVFTGLSGVLMFAADLDTFATSLVFWVKLGLIGILLANGYMMSRAEQALRSETAAGESGWRRLRRTSIASMALWLTILLLGTVLPTVGSGSAS